MTKLYFAIIFLLFSIFGFGQDTNLYYRGYFYNKKNKAEALLKVKNKRTGIVELSNSNGLVLIQAKIGDTLTWNEKSSLVIHDNWQLGELLNQLKADQKFQSANPIVSKEYQNQVNLKSFDSLNGDNKKYKTTKKSNFRYYSQVRTIKNETDSTIQIKRIVPKQLVFNARYFSSTEVKWQNGMPKLQSQYIQGRSSSAGLIYNGPETNEIFSFGPSIRDYGYDQYGNWVPNLVASKPGTAFSNSLFKPIVNFENTLNLTSILKTDNQEFLKLDLHFVQKHEPKLFLNEKNNWQNLGGKLTFNPRFGNFVLNYDYNENSATNSDRFGYYNRIYQNSLVTPISFDNRAGFLLNTGLHRRFSNQFDNPYYLDYFNENQFKSHSNTWNFQYEKKFNSRWKLNLESTLENENKAAIESFPMGSAEFSNGIINQRSDQTKQAFASAMVFYENRKANLEHYATFKYMFQNQRREIFNSFNSNEWLYKRQSNEFIFNYLPKISFDDFTIKGQLTNNFYQSTTAKKASIWNPVGIFDASVRTNSGSSFGVNTQYSDINSEVFLTNSWAYFQLTKYNPATSFQYFPMNEVESFENLDYIRKIKRNFGVYFNHRNKINFEIQYFNASILNDVVPYFVNEKLYLKNSFDHQSKGVDAKFNWDSIVRNYHFTLNSGFSFLTYKDKVTRVESGFENHPIMGFQSVYKGLKVNYSVGSIFGNSIEKDANGKPIIDANGYPKVNTNLEIIGDAVPDFILKFTHSMQMNSWLFALNWEWSKGGDIWNGTQAALDYYGRSAISGQDRMTKNYVFSGVNSQGQPNIIPVDFYNPNQSVYENRWVRYGKSGVAEWNIEDASFLRISSISISKKIWLKEMKPNVRMITISAFARNILLWKKYSGVQPQNNFFETDAGQGLDFFNLPGFTSVGLSINVEL